MFASSLPGFIMSMTSGAVPLEFFVSLTSELALENCSRQTTGALPRAHRGQHNDKPKPPGHEMVPRI